MPNADIIHGDRRANRRYRFEMASRFIYRHNGQSCAGIGTTTDLSSGGIRFFTETPPPEGVDIELHVTWPFLLQNICPMELVVWGKTVRSNPDGTAVLMQRHEFRTCGARSFDTVDTTSATCNFFA